MYLFYHKAYILTNILEVSVQQYLHQDKGVKICERNLLVVPHRIFIYMLCYLLIQSGKIKVMKTKVDQIYRVKETIVE